MLVLLLCFSLTLASFSVGVEDGQLIFLSEHHEHDQVHYDHVEAASFGLAVDELFRRDAFAVRIFFSNETRELHEEEEHHDEDGHKKKRDEAKGFKLRVVSNGGLSVSFSDGSITPEVVDLPVELVFWISVNESSVRRLFSSSVSVEDASGEFRASNPLVLSLTAPRSRPWIEKVLERYGQTRSAMLNVTEFASCYAETFPLLGGVAVVESGQDEHGHNHGRVGENISIPSYCHPANEIFEQSDANRDAFLSSEELVFTMAVFLQMTADGCHALTARVVVPACSFVRSSFAEAWGYAFLSAVLMSLISVVFGVVSMFTKFPSVLHKVLLSCGLGGGFATCIIVLFAFITRYPSFLAVFGLDGVGIDSGHELDFLWPLVVAVAVISLLQVAHQVLVGKPAKAKLLSVSVFFHSSLDEWDERSVPEVSKPSEVDYGFLFAVFAEGFLELGFGLILGACWATMTRLGLLMAAAMGIQLLFTKSAVASIISSTISGAAASFMLNLAPCAFLFVGIIAGVAAPQGSTSAARYELAFAFALWLYVALVLISPSLLRRKGFWSSAGIIVTMIAAFGVVVIIAVLGPLGRAVDSICAVCGPGSCFAAASVPFMKGPDLKDHPLLVAAKNSVNTEDVLELLELQEIEHVASYVLTESGKLCVQEKKAHWLFQSAMFSKASTSRIQSFGGCNYSNSLIRMINSLRLELMDEAAILLNDDTLIRASPLFIRCSSQPTLLQIFLVKDSCVGSLWSAEQARKVLGSDTVPPDAAMKDSVAELVKEAGRCIISMDLEEAKSHPGWRSCDLQSFRLLETFIDELRSGEMKSEMILLPAEQGVKIEKLLRIQALFNASSSLKEISVAKWFPMLWDDASWWFEKGKIKKLIELKKN